MPRRERAAVLGSILAAIDEQRQRMGPAARITNVGSAANVPYDRLVVYLEHLADAGLVVRGEGMPEITAKGREFLARYRAWVEVLDRFGLGEVTHSGEHRP